MIAQVIIDVIIIMLGEFGCIIALAGTSHNWEQFFWGVIAMLLGGRLLFKDLHQ